MNNPRFKLSVGIYLALAFGISWSAYYVQQNLGPSPWNETLRLTVKFGPSIAGIIATIFAAKWLGLTRLLANLIPDPTHWRWIAVAWALPFGVIAVSVMIRGLFQPDLLIPDQSSFAEILPLYGALLATRFFLGGGLGEELGWRGFLLPALLPSFGPFQASLLIGFAHGMWHFPAYGVATIFFVAFTVSMAFIATWLYHKCDGNLFPVVLLHANGNATLSLSEQLFPGMDNDLGFVFITFLLWAFIATKITQRAPLFKTDVPLFEPKP